MKKLIILFFILLYGIITYAQNQRTKYNFNSDWRVFVGDKDEFSNSSFDDANWKRITLPYAWNEDEAFKKDIANLSDSISWYRKHFRLPQSAQGKKVFIEFEGIRQAGQLFVNGISVGTSENGVMAFGFDITDFIKYEADNTLAFRIDNDWNYREKATNTKFQWEDKNFNANYGGINKNVYLHITPTIYQTLPLYSDLKTTGVYIYADNFNIRGKTATVHVVSEVKNETSASQRVSFEVLIKDLKGDIVRSFEGKAVNIPAGQKVTMKASAPVSNLNFWSWGYGYLYDVHSRVKINGRVIDDVLTKTGFRKTDFKDGMIYLNDRVIMIHGYAQRTNNEWPAIGISVPAWLSDLSNGLVIEGNGNLMRWMHTTPWKQDIESCDRIGLLQAMPAGDAEKDVEGIRWNQRVAVMRDAIIYNRNNPSIIFYECGNKGISEAHMKEMKAIRDVYDPHGGRAIGSREMLDSKLAEYGGEMLYTNKSANIPFWAMEYSRDEGSRKYWDSFTPPFHIDGDGPLHQGKPAPEYNRNMESHAIENVKRWYEFWRERPGTGKRVSSGGVNIGWTEANSHHRGEENYRRSGEIDALRIKKQNFYAHQVMWDGWVNPEKHHTHIIGHWNYTEDVKKDIFVISTSHKVELKVNGVSLGFGTKSDGFLFTFKNIQYVPGTISAIGYDKQGKETDRAEIKTAGAPIALRLTAVTRPNDFIADGHDLALVEVEVVDAQGNRCPTALNMVNYTLNGPAEWRGGIAMGPDNYILQKSFPVENGINRFLIRSTTEPGNINITANAEGLRGATITLITKPFVTQGGLSPILPSAGLPSRLDRGPTPATQSYSIVRKPINPIKAIAGANADKTSLSYDDNELTLWENDGSLSTAWIEYELERPVNLSEITLKLNNFRSRSYPLVIAVDNKEVFRGNTETSLGYINIPCKANKGSKIKIQLIENAVWKTKDIGVEITGKKLEEGIKGKSGEKGSLGIIEIEFYESLFPADKK